MKSDSMISGTGRISDIDNNFAAALVKHLRLIMKMAGVYAASLLVISIAAILPATALAAGHPVGLQPLNKNTYRHAAMIIVDGGIDQIQVSAIERRIHAAIRRHASLLIFRFHSSTGLVSSAMNAAKEIESCQLPTVAYIRKAAIGPAILMATACNQIIMHRGAIIGDGQTFQARQHLTFAGMARSVTDGPLKLLLQHAVAHHYPPEILAAMVDPTVVLDEISNRVTGKTELVTPRQRRALMKETVPGRAAEHPWEFVKRFKPSGSVLTLSARRARQFGLSAATVRSRSALLAYLNVTAVRVPILRLDFMEHAVRVLISPEARFILIIILVIAGWLTLTHPGWHVPILMGLVALALLLGAPMLTGVGAWWEVALVGVGVVLIIYDIFHFGGLGLLAVPGFVLILVGIGCSLVPLSGGFTSAAPLWNAAQESGGVLAGALLCGIIGSIVLIRYMQHLPGARRMILTPPKSSAAGAASDTSEPFVGAIGRAISDLRPSGKANFDGRLTDVVTDGDYILSGTAIVVVGKAQHQLLVKALDK
ncbi:MAG: hypothetical protein ACP5O1_00270 [Phycisphaerae bacterium]